MRRSFLVTYDYGQGGAWAYVVAESAAEILRRYPELKVVDRPPGWMNADELARIKAEATLHLEDTQRGLLADILHSRFEGNERDSVSSG